MAQIMAVTGHKSASSVAVYQRVSSKEKQVMGKNIFFVHTTVLSLKTAFNFNLVKIHLLFRIMILIQ
jgi:hypothetical protein